MAQRLQPEQQAREQIDTMLKAAGWEVQDAKDVNLYAARGVAVREFRMAKGHGVADYLLFVDHEAVGALEAKKVGDSLSGVMLQAKNYSEGLPRELDAIRPLPFLYVSTGVETLFANRLDPEPRSRGVFAIHRPETLAEWLEPDRFYATGAHQLELGGLATADKGRPQTLRHYLQSLPPIPGRSGLWPNQIEAISKLERSLADNRPRALIQMATGSGKSKTAVASIYRLLKFGGARRVLFLVDRNSLGKQAEDEFAKYISYDDNRRFTELYGVQRLKGHTIAASSAVVITTIQRFYSMLRGEPFADEDDERSSFDDGTQPATPKEVVYNAAIPPEYFDVVFIDECHRSIYTLWRQVIEYFDAFLVGLTATPANHTYGFFQGNVVTQYDHDAAIADGVNVDFDIYRIQTRITEQGSTIKAETGVMVGKRDRRTRRQRWEQPDQDITYTGTQLDRDVVAEDQIRLAPRPTT